MDDTPRNETVSESEIEFTSNTAKERSKELTNHGQPSSHEGKELSSKVLSKASVIAQAETDTNTLNLTLTDCRVILVGQPNKAELLVRCNHCCDQDRLQCETFPKEPDSDDRSEQHKGEREKVECYLQLLFNEGEIRSDSGPKVADCVERPMDPIQVQGDLSGKPCLSELILERLEFLQDNGIFDEHDSLMAKAKHYYEKRQNADMLLLLEIEQAAPLSYRGHSKLATRKLKSVIKSDLKSRALHPDIITGKAYFLLAAHMRRDKNLRYLKFYRILECLRVSECLLVNYDSPENLSELYQTYGSVWLDRMSQIPRNDERNARARNHAGEKAKYYFAKAIYFSKQDDRQRVQMKRQKYSHHKFATIHLDSCSPFALAQEKPIPPSEIKEAEKHLDIILELGGSLPMATLMLFKKSQSDRYSRLGQYQLAKERAEEAYKIACDQEFKTEFEPLQKRIDLLKEKLQTPDHIVSNEVHIHHDQSSSDTGYCSSGDDSQ